MGLGLALLPYRPPFLFPFWITWNHLPIHSITFLFLRTQLVILLPWWWIIFFSPNLTHFLFAIEWGHLLFDLFQTSMFWLRSIHFLDFFIFIITPASWLSCKGQFMWKSSFYDCKEVTVYMRMCENTKTPAEKKKKMGTGKVIQLTKEDVEIATTYSASIEKISCNFSERNWSIYLYLCLCHLLLSLAVFIDWSISIPTSLSRLISSLKISFLLT